ncbi:MAG: hypothetical protein AAGI01_13655, partial [Myxococcota bacterium]
MRWMPCPSVFSYGTLTSLLLFALLTSCGPDEPEEDQSFTPGGSPADSGGQTPNNDTSGPEMGDSTEMGMDVDMGVDMSPVVGAGLCTNVNDLGTIAINGTAGEDFVQAVSGMTTREMMNGIGTSCGFEMAPELVVQFQVDR